MCVKTLFAISDKYVFIKHLLAKQGGGGNANKINVFSGTIDLFSCGYSQ